jgi:hypothetical protein
VPFARSAVVYPGSVYIGFYKIGSVSALCPTAAITMAIGKLASWRYFKDRFAYFDLLSRGETEESRYLVFLMALKFGRIAEQRADRGAECRWSNFIL